MNQRMLRCVKAGWLLFFISMTVPVTGYVDQFQRLSADEIRELLSGNTAIGSWDGVSYRQYFDVDGTTIYAQKGSRSSLGRWRVDENKEVYQSWWTNSDWADYPVARLGDELFWLSRSLPPQPFYMVPGQQLAAEKSP